MEDLDFVLGKRVTHCSLRHRFITRKLIAEVNSHVVAAQTGHKDTQRVDHVYSHVAD
jgi:integrase